MQFTVTLRPKSRRTHDILLSHLRLLDSHFVASYDSQGYGEGIVNQSHFTGDSQSVLVSSPLFGRLTRYWYLSKSLGLEFVVLSLWGARSEDLIENIVFIVSLLLWVDFPTVPPLSRIDSLLRLLVFLLPLPSYGCLFWLSFAILYVIKRHSSYTFRWVKRDAVFFGITLRGVMRISVESNINTIVGSRIFL
jgi:hypothetical protein